MALKIDHQITLRIIHGDENETIKLLKQILNINQNIMSKATDIEAKVDLLQTKLDTEQEEILASTAELKAELQVLKDLIAAGASDNEALDRSLAKLDAITADLEATVTPTPPVEPQP